MSGVASEQGKNKDVQIMEAIRVIARAFSGNYVINSCVSVECLLSRLVQKNNMAKHKLTSLNYMCI